MVWVLFWIGEKLHIVSTVHLKIFTHINQTKMSVSFNFFEMKEANYI